MERGQIVFSPSVPQAIEKAFKNEPLYKTDPAVPEPYSRSIRRAISFKIETTASNFAQYVRTVKAFIAARLPFRYIANAGTFLEDKVESREVTAPIRDGWQNKAAEIAEDSGKVIAWQDRGEGIEVTHQLPSGVSGEQGKVIPITDYLADVENKQQKVGVVEGVAVFTNQPPQLTQPSSGSLAPKDNPYLQAPADLKKAA